MNLQLVLVLAVLYVNGVVDAAASRRQMDGDIIPYRRNDASNLRREPFGLLRRYHPNNDPSQPPVVDESAIRASTNRRQIDGDFDFTRPIPASRRQIHESAETLPPIIVVIHTVPTSTSKRQRDGPTPATPANH